LPPLLELFAGRREMSITLDLPLSVERKLRDEAAQSGRAPGEIVLNLLSDRYRDTESRARCIERNQSAIALLRLWQSEETDLEEAEGYPAVFEPLQLREISLEP
jgi:hypothetical protein